MSLVTRCPACGTVFRVVQDQLKVSEGWVRCGRCSEVFNAVDGLFDLDHEDDAVVALADEGTAAFVADERSTLGEASPLRVDALMDAVTQTAVVPAPPPDGTTDDGTSPAEATEELNAVYARLVPSALPSALQADVPAASPPDEIPDALPDAQADTSIDTTPSVEPLAESPIADQGLATHTPDFVRRADQAARWRHPGLRGALALLSLLLAAALAAQVTVHYRDGLAANWPASRPWLQWACGLAGCRIEAPRRIDAISVDSSGLLRADTEGDGGLYRLTLVLNNRSATEVSMPAIDLALTDAKGQTMIRRVLYASDLGQPATTLSAHSELAMQGLLDLGELRVSGYTVELFYP